MALDELQAGDVRKPAVDEEWIIISGGPAGSVQARIVKPAGTETALPVVLYIHGAGRVFGDAHTHDRLVRELAVGAAAAVVFPEYDLSPEARYPVAIEQSFPVAQWVVEQGATKDLDGSRLAVAGDSDKLRQAGVPVTAVRFQAVIHDFVMLDALRDTHAARTATDLAARTLGAALHTT
ncbi:hypothetical protein AQI95_04405 [Streptomyces yokosukanensis]|uniref:Alpha/beta hydrolase fold-3 domain-containing protein n=1 Tax=Streptomyces yokosukanensis TaxID=67386 RepID=A0A117Q5I0_9ACTN|nr:hypothetical protein AQI95_04405 [Streptomyces yokosukanensis]